MRLNKQDFDILDGLLCKIGFGSYYDCIQLLKDAIYSIKPELRSKLEKVDDLLLIVNLLNHITKKIKEVIKD